MDVHVPRTVPISYEMVARAYQKVKKGGQAAGIDQESWKDFEAKGVERQLYVVWNRLSSGSYHPQAVREVEIPKKNGRMRKLGIPTVRDRIAQQVVKDYMEKRVDKKFHKNSYGYRPMKSSHEALEEVRKNCLEKDWVIDLDISNFFDEIDHELMLKAVEAMHDERWVRVYTKRWLEMKVERGDGQQYDRGGRGTPQGGVISPLLANLFLHFALDQWLSKNYPQVPFVRYADDVVVHCRSKQEAEEVLCAIGERLAQVKLSLNEDKTKTVYCKDYRRKGEHKNVQFDFLGFSFQPRPMHSMQQRGTTFMAFSAQISRGNQAKIRTSIRQIVNWRDTTLELGHIAEKLNRKIRGWVNYFDRYGKSKLRQVLIYLDMKLVKWLKHKHKCGLRKAIQHLASYQRQTPQLFYHWIKKYCLNVNKLTRAV